MKFGRKKTIQKKAISKKSISKKLIMLLTIIAILPTTILGVISYTTASNITASEIINSANGKMTSIQDNMDNFIKMQEENLLIIAQNASILNINNINPEDMLYVKDILKTNTEGHNAILSMYVAREDKQIEIYPETKLPDGFDPTTRPWYQSAISKNGLAWTDPYVDVATGKLVVTLATPLYNENKELVGVLGADISLEQLTNIIGNASIGSTGYVFLLDNKDIVLTHPDRTLIGKEVPVEELKRKTNPSERGSVDYTYYNSRKCAYYSTIKNTGWRIIGEFNYSEISDKTQYILLISLISGLCIVAISILVGILATRPITKSIKEITNDMLKIGDGDFTIRTNINSSDEIGILAQNVNKMLENLGLLMRNVIATVSEVSNSADMLAASSEEITASTEEISRTVVEISNATLETAQSVENGLYKTKEVADNIQGVSESINVIKDMVDKSNQLNQDGIQTVEDLKINSSENTAASEKVSNAIIEVDKCSQQVGDIINSISGIADQTNLLALNASIEAARAGEAGKGFSVVAEEIRKLAEQSTKATDNIKKLIIEIQTQSRNAVSSMEDAKPIVEAQSQSVEKTQRIFSDISENITKLTYEISEIIKLNNKMVSSKDEILAIMEDVSATSEETSASTQQVSASTQEQLTGMEDVARTAEELNILANKLSVEIDKFKV
ncbi:methyl-accepting chemotaxis protein [Ruminiclostridium herbifermentans]|uniref:Methyl-accepting chemotaxis protein n=1 Tax=Ruminiclostridium herbifermentans TaxID=2488810 RepID=A0A7H1VQ48_9FIRM|nr:methyl-accepting chemotaxis protein [Ruminiclostridium herbifermentans]QNU67510.1 methyl-accepting chemotaxis protein [Ruminiclostridium herbifermentans]